MARQHERVASWRRLLAAYDVDRQLERGYSLTLTADGKLVRSAGALDEEQEIVTRFADGTVESRVIAVRATGPDQRRDDVTHRDEGSGDGAREAGGDA